MFQRKYFCEELKNSSVFMYIFSASLFNALIHLTTSPFFLFIRVILSFTNFCFLERSSAFCFLTFSVMYLLFPNLQLLRKPLEDHTVKL